jgi:hypothetical protein
MDALE